MRLEGPSDFAGVNLASQSQSRCQSYEGNHLPAVKDVDIDSSACALDILVSSIIHYRCSELPGTAQHLQAVRCSVIIHLCGVPSLHLYIHDFIVGLRWPHGLQRAIGLDKQDTRIHADM